jgi:hypothetical protein
MIFGGDRISCDDFGDRHDEITVAGGDFIGRRPICGLYLQGEGVLLGASNEDSYSGSSISSLMVVERKSRFRDDESASYVVPDDATADIFSSVHMRFGLVPKRWILRYVQCFGGGRWIQHKDRTSALAFKERHWEEDDGRI